MRNQAIRKRRLLLFVTLAVVIAVNLAAVFLPYRAAHPDVSGNGVYTLTNASRNYVRALEHDVRITYHATDPDPDIRSFLDLYKAPHVTVAVSEPPSAAEDQTVRIACGEDERTVGISDLFYYSSKTYSPEYGYLSMTQYARITAQISAMSSSDEAYQAFTYYFGPDVMQAHFCGEEVITSTLRNLAGGTMRTVWVLTGEVGQAPDWYVMLRLKMHGFEAHAVSDPSALPDGALLWLTPQKDLDENGVTALEGFLSRGGRLFLTTLYSQMRLPKLAAVLAAYGLVGGDRKGESGWRHGDATARARRFPRPSRRSVRITQSTKRSAAEWSSVMRTRFCFPRRRGWRMRLCSRPRLRGRVWSGPPTERAIRRKPRARSRLRRRLCVPRIPPALHGSGCFRPRIWTITRTTRRAPTRRRFFRGLRGMISNIRSARRTFSRPLS